MTIEGEASTEQEVKVRAVAAAIRWTVRLGTGAAILFIAGLILFVGMIEDSANGDPPKADGIVALTGGDERVTEAIRLLAAGNGKRLLISGVHPRTTKGALIRLNPDSARLFQCCIDLDRKARDTSGNADETRAWAERQGFRSLIVVTSSYHMPRSLVELRRALHEATLIPHPVAPRKFHISQWWAYPGTLRLVVSEYVKFLPAVARCLASQTFGHGRKNRRMGMCFRPAGS